MKAKSMQETKIRQTDQLLKKSCSVPVEPQPPARPSNYYEDAHGNFEGNSLNNFLEARNDNDAKYIPPSLISKY